MNTPQSVLRPTPPCKRSSLPRHSTIAHRRESTVSSVPMRGYFLVLRFEHSHVGTQSLLYVLRLAAFIKSCSGDNLATRFTPELARLSCRDNIAMTAIAAS